jgi:hypothetical protein
MLAASRQSFALYVLAPIIFRIVRLSINACTQCARWCSAVLGLALPHEQVYQDARQHCLVLCCRLNLAWCASFRGNPSHQCRLFHLNHGPLSRVLYSNRCTVDLEEG